MNNGLASTISALNFLESNNDINKTNKTYAKEIPVLNYHGFTEKFDGSNILAEDFKKQMFALKENGWQTIGIDDFYKFIKGEKQLPEKSFLITFDDGRKDSYYPADPILKALDYKAVMFIITSHSLYEDSDYYLTKKEVKTMLDSGRWDIQVHTKDGHDVYDIDEFGNKGHFFSNKLWKKDENRIETDEEFETRIVNDFTIAKEDLKKELDVNAIGFAFPFGDYGQETINFPNASNIVLKNIKEIYPMAFYQVRVGDGFTLNYPNDYSSDNMFFMIKRISVRPDWSEKNLLEILKTSSAKSLPYEDNFKYYNGWIKEYGNLEIGNGILKIGSSEMTTGASVFLDGTRSWDDYIFNTIVDWNSGVNITLFARFINDDNYTSCLFSDSNLKIEQRLKGNRRVLVNKKNIYSLPKENLRLGISVIGDTVRCFINGNQVAYAHYLSPVLENGGIGLKTWDRELGNSLISIKNIKAEEVKTDKDIELALASLKEDLTVKESVTAEQKKKEEEARKKQQAALVALNKKKQSSSSSVSSSAALSSSSSKPTTISSSSSSISTPPIYLTDTSGISTPYTAKSFADISGWKNLSGEVWVKDGTLHVGSNASTTAGMTVLAGSKDWTDYNFRTKLDWNKGSTFTLIARYQDNKNYMSCTFSHYGEYARIYQTVNGKTKTLGKSGRLPIPFMEPWLNNDYSVIVNGNEIKCLVNNQWVLKYNTDEMPKFGGIGLKTWDANPAYSEVSVRELRAETIGN
ncbi:MAG: polysaccharide deacetylase family protein [Candidatus Pacebacteria bacterium]|nr:polysaccharide deacetylase family protein [Candidatus Paceibacterota bacterium]